MKIALLGCKGTTLDLLSRIICDGRIGIDLVLTLPEESAIRNGVAFYAGEQLRQYCEMRQFPIHWLRSYNLSDAEDVAFFDRVGIDLLLVIGWERLIPEAVLKHLGKFACGMHGSPYGLPKGRGRSPLNWSLITGHRKFVTYLFRYNSGVDAGSVIGFKVFDINEFDTIATLHMKNRIAMNELLWVYLPLIERGEICFWPQPPETPTYYPKRTPADGAIDWREPTTSVYNLIRAVSAPYPSAYCLHKGRKLVVLRAQPFDSGLFHQSIAPGSILDISVALRQFVVKTGDGSLIVSAFSGIQFDELQVGQLLESSDTSEILQQVTSRYPCDLAEEEMEIRPPKPLRRPSGGRSRSSS